MHLRDGYHPGIRGSALVLVDDRRAALASVLVLQEMGFSVDIAARPQAALSWVRLARYEWIVGSGGELTGSTEYLAALRANAPRARILIIGADAPVDVLDMLAIKALAPPVNVNMLVDRFAREPA